MKKRIIFLLFVSLLYSMQVAAQFEGSNGDGYDNTAVSSITLTNLSLEILYDGSNGDGFSNRILSATTLENISLAILYDGSNGDGFANRILSATTLNNEQLAILYEGSNGDGFSNRTLSATTLENTNLAVLYDGSNGDGFSNRMLSATTLENTSLTVLYEGSNGDGFSNRILSATTLENISLVVLYQGSNGDGFSVRQENVFLDPNQIVDLRLAIKAILQGPIINPTNPGLMNDILRTDGIIPTMSPYPDMSTINASVLNTGGTSGTGLASDDIVDWVWIEIRSNTDNTSIVDDRSALLQRDGDVVGLDGLSTITLEGFTDSYYVVIKHRNHLGIMTLKSIPLSVVTTNIDFSNPITATFGTDAQVLLPSGNNALWAGDANGDGRINYSGSLSDVPSVRSQVFNDPNNSVFGGPPVASYPSEGYNNTDVDMDGVTVYSGASSDILHIRSNIFNNPSNTIFGGPPTSTYLFTQQLPEGAN
ncbi:hypothetical protein [uncultured Lacinutrix sp.]|uniref:hypothetical protein n=1 Tax=uncultured Lacinutrix sp. TaxID=574032 RepID=UPI00261DE1DC|nr:hypothetical protein [uncultured Lacinutrix sp.]